MERKPVRVTVERVAEPVSLREIAVLNGGATAFESQEEVDQIAAEFLGVYNVPASFLARVLMTSTGQPKNPLFSLWRDAAERKDCSQPRAPIYSPLVDGRKGNSGESKGAR